MPLNRYDVATKLVKVFESCKTQAQHDAATRMLGHWKRLYKWHSPAEVKVMVAEAWTASIKRVDVASYESHVKAQENIRKRQGRGLYTPIVI